MNALNERKGSLTKLGYKSAKWQKRWVVLLGTELSYYLGEYSLMSQGSFSLVGCKVETVKEGSPITHDMAFAQTIGQAITLPYCFRIEIPGRTYVFAASNEIERDNWISEIISRSGVVPARAATTASPAPVGSGLSVEQMEAIKKAEKEIGGGAVMQGLDKSQMEKLKEVILKLPPGMSGLAVEQATPGMLAASVGLRAFVDVITKYEGTTLPTNGDLSDPSILQNFALAKKKAFETKGSFELEVYDVNTKQTRAVVFDCPSKNPDTPIGLGASYVKYMAGTSTAAPAAGASNGNYSQLPTGEIVAQPSADVLAQAKKLEQDLNKDGGSVALAGVSTDKMTILKNMWEALPEGVGALGVSEVKPGGVASQAGLREGIDAILEYEGSVLPPNAEMNDSSLLGKFAEAKKHAFQTKGSFDFVVYDTRTKEKRNVSLPCPTRDPNAPIGLGVSYIKHRAPGSIYKPSHQPYMDLPPIYAEGWLPTKFMGLSGKSSTNKKFNIYDPPSPQNLDIEVEVWKKTSLMGLAGYTKLGYHPLYRYVSLNEPLFVEGWKATGSVMGLQAHVSVGYVQLPMVR
eukprot:TRINITY_DN13778_c0_g1_i1.p1 TRINITY_DN13778_c0_g1~~TRINITY_DN13778_c0_g1_i1.p1  ORF type:complete len:598 (-),score=118.80 TRINITY_DN13778_c0_g1_i1:58-1776(-)